MQIIKERWKRLWNSEEIRILVLVSLCLQFGLIFLSPLRKHTSQKVLILLLWFFYLVADYVAILALGNLLKKQNEGPSSHHGDVDLMAFWAPFLLLHLGGPDTITSYSIEDNELWWRHFLELAVQVVVAFMVLLELEAIPGLRVAAAFVFLAGLIKYSERTWALRSSSMDTLRNSMVGDPDRGPDYAEFMEKYVWRRESGQSAYIKRKNEPPPASLPSNNEAPGNIYDVDQILEAYVLFKRFKPIVVDLMLSFQERRDSQKYFWTCSVSKAFIVVEIELSFLYDVFHTKAINIRGLHGCLWRLISLGMISSALLLFLKSDKRGCAKGDITISYVLLGSALFMEFISFLLIIISDWMIVTLKKKNHSNLSVIITKVMSCFLLKRKHRWSNTMGQYNLLSVSLGDKKPRIRCNFGVLKVKELCKKPIIRRILGAFKVEEFWLMKKVKELRLIKKVKELRLIKKVKELCLINKVKGLWDNYFNIYSVHVPKESENLLFDALKNKSESARTTTDFKELRDCRVEKVLQQETCNDLRWSIDKEFDESILLWHIATDICFHSNGAMKENPEAGHGRNGNKSHSDREISLIMSNYMVYLLIMQPSMMPAGIGKIRFQDTCAEAKNFFQKLEKGLTREDVIEALLDVETEVDPIEVKGDRSKSVLFDACRLAKELNILGEDDRWRLINKVWVEMLGYAAINCKTYYHAKQLSQGGEFLTHIWLLMAHMGIGEQYRIEAGHAVATLAYNN